MRALRISHVAHPDGSSRRPRGRSSSSPRVAGGSRPALAAGADEPPAPATLSAHAAARAAPSRTSTASTITAARCPRSPRPIPSPRSGSRPPTPPRAAWTDGAAIRIVNERGAMQARALVTDRIPAGTVWMRDGWLGLNELTAGAPAIPDAAVARLPALGFSGGQATFDARVEVERGLSVEIPLSRSTLRPWRAATRPRWSATPTTATSGATCAIASPLPTPRGREGVDRAAGAESPVANFAIVVSGDAIGGIGLRLGTDVFRRSAEIGYWLGEPLLGPRHRHRGRARGQPSMRSRTSTCAGWRPASSTGMRPPCACSRKPATRCEGRTRLSVTKDGRTGDHVLYGLVRA